MEVRANKRRESGRRPVPTSGGCAQSSLTHARSLVVVVALSQQQARPLVVVVALSQQQAHSLARHATCAPQAFQTAADYYNGEESTSAANQCLLKVALLILNNL